MWRLYGFLLTLCIAAVVVGLVLSLSHPGSGTKGMGDPALLVVNASGENGTGIALRGWAPSGEKAAEDSLWLLQPQIETTTSTTTTASITTGLLPDSAPDSEPHKGLQPGTAAFYESVGNAWSEASPDEERQLRRRTATNQLAVHLVEQHHQALRWWSQAVYGVLPPARIETNAREPARRLLVHVDSHGDIGVGPWGPWVDLRSPGKASLGRAELAQAMAKEMGIGSFVAAAVAAGLLSDVVWLRSSFHGCRYNGPPRAGT